MIKIDNLEKDIKELTDYELSKLKERVDKEIRIREGIRKTRSDTLEELIDGIDERGITAIYCEEENTRRAKESDITERLYKEICKLPENSVISHNDLYFTIYISKQKEYYSIRIENLKKPEIIYV